MSNFLTINGPVFAVSMLLALPGCTGSGKSTATATVDGTLQVCSSCHGSDGRSISPTFPRLAGQQADYLVVQLKAFRDKSRADPHAHTYMWGMAAKLDDKTIAGIADAYSAMVPAPGTPQDPSLVSAGSQIFENGVTARDIPACISCHGEGARGNSVFPRLAGQHVAYLQEQLQSFQNKSRDNEIMHDSSKNLTPQEIDQITAYLAAQ